MSNLPKLSEYPYLDTPPDLCDIQILFECVDDEKSLNVDRENKTDKKYIYIDVAKNIEPEHYKNNRLYLVLLGMLGFSYKCYISQNNEQKNFINGFDLIYWTKVIYNKFGLKSTPTKQYITESYGVTKPIMFVVMSKKDIIETIKID